jgi:hypothetical protein
MAAPQGPQGGRHPTLHSWAYTTQKGWVLVLSQPNSTSPLLASCFAAHPITRLAYIELSGTLRVVPISYLWERPRVIVCTVPTSAKVKAVRQTLAVAMTIDYEGQPIRALLLRGRDGIEIVDGVPPGVHRCQPEDPERAGC